jgi:hypothetical protein
MRDKSSEIRQLEAEAARILKRRQRHDDRGRQLAEAEKHYQEATETLILSAIRAAGLTKLPLSELLDSITALSLAAGISDVGESVPKNNDNFGAAHPQVGGSEPETEVDRGGREVFVKLSSNTSVANRETLEKSGLRWNGRLGGWKGKVGDDATVILRERFGDRLILSAPLAPEGGSGEGATDKDPTANPPSSECADRPTAAAGGAFEIAPLAGRDAGG